MDSITIIDEAFTVALRPWGTYSSFSNDGTPLITSASEEECVKATRWYLKHLQDETE